MAEHGFAAFLATKHVDPDPQDPIEDLRAGWDVAIEFGLANPALFTLMYTEPTRTNSAAFKAGMEILMGRIRRLAAGGWLNSRPRSSTPRRAARCSPGCPCPRTGATRPC